MENTLTFDELNEIDDINSMCDELSLIESIEREIEQEDINYQLTH